MTKTSKTIVFFGNERLATGVTTEAPAFRALVENGYKIAVLIVSQNDPGKSRKARDLEIVAIAEDKGIPVMTIDKLADHAQDIRDLGAEAAVLVAYGKLVPPEVISIFPKGIINIHPSLLPKHRGPTPLESLILAGEEQTGVSLMRLSPELDSGPVYAQQTVDVTAGATKQALAEQLGRLGKDMLIEHLPAILEGSLEPQPQDDTAATFDNHIDKTDSQLDWSKSAAHLEREVRAYAGWPRSRARIGDIDVIITAVHVMSGTGEPGEIWRQGKEFGVFTSDGVLVIDRLIPAGKKGMSAEGFLAGYKI